MYNGLLYFETQKRIDIISELAGAARSCLASTARALLLVLNAHRTRICFTDSL